MAAALRRSESWRMDDRMNRREQRRRRRRRNQMIAYIVAGLILAGLVFGCIFAARYISGSAQGGDSGSGQQNGGETAGELNADGQTDSAQAEVSGREEAFEQVGGSEQTGLFEQPGVSGQPEASEQAGVSAQTDTAAAQGTAEALEEQISGYVEAMKLEEKVAGLFIITPEQLTGVGTAIQPGESTREALEKYPVGGLVYFARNIQSASQLREMLANTASYSRYPLFLGVDEEGGQVARVAKALGLENVGPMGQIGASGDPSRAYAAGASIASYLKEYGFNLDFAPVADVLTNPDNTVIGDRSFGSDPAVVAQMTASAVQGLQENGVSACVKHFPGHGNTAGDSHEGQVETDRTLEEMQAVEFLPFTAGMEAGVDMVMVGHISAPGLTDGDKLPASMNEKIITDILRGQLGYNGIVITDAMNMSAISQYYTADEAAIRALKAGADMILMPEDFVTAYEGVIAAVQGGTIAEERIDDSLKRVFRVKFRAEG